MFEIKELTLDHTIHPMAFDTSPRVGWIAECSHSNAIQTKYHIQISVTEEFEDLVWDSGVVDSEQSANIETKGLNLIPSSRYFVRAKIWNNCQEITPWSAPIAFLSGTNGNWHGSFITAETVDLSNDSSGYYLRKQFEISEDLEIESAVIHMSGCGVYKAFINGDEIGDDELKPGFTSYNKNMLYQSYDLTNALSSDNVIAFHVAPGWYKGRLGFYGERNLYGDKTAIICELVIQYTNGEQDRVISDASWLSHSSPLLFAEIYDGEIYDGRKELEGWNTIHGDIKDWHAVEELTHAVETLAPQTSCTVRRHEIFQPKAIFTTPQGDIVIDFGQNLSGLVEFNINGLAGERVVIEHFESLDAKGNVYLDNLRSALQKVEYILGNDGQHTYCPGFSFQGFRYIRVTEYPGSIEAENFKVHALYSDIGETGTFKSSNELLNKLHSNITWGMRSNFVDIPTDCPQRDERLGWTGDAQVFAKTASYLSNTRGFFAKWLKDLSADQTEEGGVPHVIPDVLTGRSDHDPILSIGTHSSAAWGDAAIIIPWTLYMMYGDNAILSHQYESMKAYLDFMHTHSEELIYNYKLQFGDWVALDAEEGSYFGATPTELTGTAFFAYSTHLFAKIAHILGLEQEAKEYSELYENIKQAYHSAFIKPDGSLSVETQTAHIISLHFDLVPEQSKRLISYKLTQLLKDNAGALNTGFVGTPYFCYSLSDNGYTEQAYDLLLREEFPSWLDQVKQGATTIWEHWDGIKPDGTMWSADMNSFNHYAYGSVGEWIYSRVLGINPIESSPGFKCVHIKPLMNKKLSYVKGTFRSVYGAINVEWRVVGERKFELMVQVPFNTRAFIEFDNNTNITVHSDNNSLLNNNSLEVGSGRYTFTVEYVDEHVAVM